MTTPTPPGVTTLPYKGQPLRASTLPWHPGQPVPVHPLAVSAGAPGAARGIRPPVPAHGATGKAANKFIVARRAAAKAAAAGGTGTDPNAPPDPYDQIIAGMPQPQSNGQMSQEAQSEIAPLVAAIIASITGQTKSAVSGITGYADDAASKLAAINYGQPYQQAEGAQAAVDQTLASSLAGAGSSDAQSLQQRLAVINDPSVAAAAANVSANGTGAANADTAQGSAALTNLIANAAAANSYGQKLPGIQRAQGLQDIAGVEQTANNNIAAGTQAAEGQLPSILSSLRSENDNRSSAIASARQNQLARNDNIAAGSAAAIQKAQTTNANNQVKLTIASENNGTKLQVAAENRAASAARASVAAAAKAGKPPPASTLKYWSTTADNLYNGVSPKTHYVAQHPDPATGKIVPGGFVPVPGTGSDAVQWPVAVKELMARGATKAQAIAQLTAVGWAPGEAGRPPTAAQAKDNAQGAAFSNKVTSGLFGP